MLVSTDEIIRLKGVQLIRNMRNQMEDVEASADSESDEDIEVDP